ncbi:collagen-binding domain-containing protein [Limosilactobacillus kribbianus]|uniref:collagen-binding domain-containing protein n=1 Tax=Limosilactobacillus kribbianus TaxID=2982695 RepID=UPI0022650BC8|nr:collagen-binding domain-containing protein [Limosilactobacillus kribbianus]
MVSKNNLQLLERKQQSRKQRFGLRKMSIGLVSVLLGLLFITNGNSASADEVATSEPATTAQASPDTATLSSATVAETSSAASSTAVSSSPVSSVPAESVNTTSSTANAPESALLAPALTASSSSVISEENASSANTNSIAAATSGTVQPVSSAIDNTVNDSEQPASEGARQDTTVGTVDTIRTDQILKDKYGIDVNHLDAKSVLLLASLFHIFANEANLGADVNGNIAVGNLNSNVDFGTRGESIHLTNGDIYYIQNLNAALQNGSFRNQEFNHVIFGEDVNVGIRDGQVYVNGEHMPNLKPEEVFKDGAGTSYIDFPAVFQRLIAASNFYAEQAESAGVIKDFNDMNNRYVDVSNAVAKDNVIYVNIPYEYLNGPQPIKIYGLSSRVNGPTVVINVIGMPADGQLDINTQIKLYYDDDRDNHVSPGESHAHPNHVLWNFGTAAADITIGSGHFMGSILAPNATVTANVNVDGNIVANVVNIKGGESHKWDIHPVQPTDPQPTDPQPTDPQPTDPQPTDPQPTDPQPTDPQPTDPQPTDPQPTDPQPTDPQPTDPQPTDPQPTDPQPTDPQPTDPQPTDPQPTDPQPTDPQPTDPQPTDPILPPTGEMEDAGAEPTGSQENATEQPTHSNTMNLGTTTVSYTSNQLTASPAHTAEQTATPTNASKNQTLPQTGASHEQAVLAGIILAITAQLLALGALSWKKYNEE